MIWHLYPPSQFFTEFLNIEVEVFWVFGTATGLCLSVSKDLLPAKYLAPNVLIALDYCVCQLSGVGGVVVMVKDICDTVVVVGRVSDRAMADVLVFEEDVLHKVEVLMERMFIW